MFGGGGGGLDPRKMQQMMEQMGIDIEEIDAEEVVIRTADEELVFDDADVQRMDAQGQATYQVVGEPRTRERGAGSTDAADADAADESDADDAIPQADVDLVAEQTGAGTSAAREALEAEGGDLAAAIERLE
jgi:nascent polypeptide-associated complex subunit alpha